MTQLAQQPSSKRDVRLDLDSRELAATYEEVSTRQFNHGKLLIQELQVRPGERVLDVGCGTGRLGDFVANLVAPTGQVVGVHTCHDRCARLCDDPVRATRQT